MAQRIAVTIDLGADVPIEVIREVVDNLDTVCQFGGELQYRTAIVDAAAAVLNDPQRWIRNRDFEKQAYRLGRFQFPIVAYARGMPPSALVQSGLVEVAIARYLEETETTADSITTVHSIRYSNPIEIVVGIGLVAYLVLQVVRGTVQPRGDSRGGTTDEPDDKSGPAVQQLCFTIQPTTQQWTQMCVTAISASEVTHRSVT
jgi:hypothetical protein